MFPYPHCKVQWRSRKCFRSRFWIRGNSSNKSLAHSPSISLWGLSLVLRWKNESVSHSVVTNSLQPHGLSPARLLCPWNSPGNNTRVGFHSFLQGIFLTQGSNLGLPHYRHSLQSEPPWKPIFRVVLVFSFLDSQEPIYPQIIYWVPWEYNNFQLYCTPRASD